MGTGGKSRQQDRTVDDAGRRHLRIVGSKPGLDLIEQELVDDRRNGDLDYFALRLLLPSLRRPHIVFPAADIGGIGEDQMQRADAERAAPLGPVAPAVQPGADRLDAKRRRGRGGIAIGIEPEDELYRLLLDRIDLQLLLHLLTAPFGFEDSIAERRR